MQTVSVIVSKCVSSGDRIYGDRLVDATFRNLGDAFQFSRDLRAKGISVVVRPNYNEKDFADERFFREFRSFNGDAFQEVRWQF